LDAFNEAYGFVAGEEVLRFTGMVLNDAVDELGTENDFVGHIGGDDFIVITRASLVDALRETIVQHFSKDVGTHYDFMTRLQGYLLVEDDEGNKVHAPLMSLAIGTLTEKDGPFTDIREITEAAAEARRRGSA
jgi:GGDEF domain-containing protein